MDSIEHLLADSPHRAALLKRPLVTLCYAQSLDGGLTVRPGRPTLLSGPESSRLTHQLRAAHAGVLVGIGTVLADDPQLNVRLVEGPNPQPVVLDGGLRIPLESRLVCRERNLPWVVCRANAPEDRQRKLRERGVRLIPVQSGPDGRTDLAAALCSLHELGLDSLMVEGGARVLSSFLAARLADQAVVTLAPVWLGGMNLVEPGAHLNSVESSPADEMEAGCFPALVYPTCALYGRDIVIWGRIGEERV